jgi:hypothetical protein
MNHPEGSFTAVIIASSTHSHHRMEEVNRNIRQLEIVIGFHRIKRTDE